MCLGMANGGKSAEMTDKDVIKALGCCSSDSKKSCKKCPYVTVKGFCYNKLEKDAIDLINRQKVEIERLNNNLSAMATTLSNSARETRNEAIKEFAERLKGFRNGNYIFVTTKLIDNLVKEMVGDNNG